MKGITVQLGVTTQTGTDGFGAPSYTTQFVDVDNVLVGEPTTDDIIQANDLYGKRIQYMLGIPKGDAHNWTDTEVRWTDAYGTTHRMQTFGFPITGVEHLVPTPWHMKVRCEVIE